MSTTLKALHDRLLEGKPEDADHSALDCPFCIAATAEHASANHDGGKVADAKTYTQEEQDALLAQVEDLKARVAELTKVTEDSELETKIAAVKAELEAQVSDLQSKLDAAVLEAEAAKNERDNTIAYLDQIRTDAEEAEARSARKEERINQVKEVASFPDEYLEANSDRFAAMSDEEFEKALEDWKVIAPKNAGSSIPRETAMASRSTTTSTSSSLLSEVLDLRNQGVDVRNL